MSLVFQYDLKEEDYLNWRFCWSHIAESTILRDIRDYKDSDDSDKKEYFLIETHIYENIIKKITPVTYVGCELTYEDTEDATKHIDNDNLSETLSELQQMVKAMEKRLDSIEEQLKQNR